MKFQLHLMRNTPEGLIVNEQETGEVHGVWRLTDAGASNKSNGFWYFFRHFEDKPDQLYVYRKMRTEASKDAPEGEIIEEYVGKTFPAGVPRAWINKLKRRALK